MALTVVCAQSTDDPGVPGNPRQAALVRCPPTRPNDFNGDGKRDLVAAYTWDVTTTRENGRVREIDGEREMLDGRPAPKGGFLTIVYGGSGRRQVISQSTPGVPGEPESEDDFGSRAASADLNGDGYSDLLVAATHEVSSERPGDDVGLTGRITLLYGGRKGLTTSGARRFPNGGQPYTMAVSDLDCDGSPELAVAYRERVRVYRNPATGDRLVAVTTLDHHDIVKSAVSDFTGDGYPDLALFDVEHGIGSHLYVYKGSPGGLVSRPSLDSHLGFFDLDLAADFDGDGRAELVRREHSGQMDFLQMTADDKLRPLTTAVHPIGHFPEAIAVGDADGDGRTDLAIADLDETVVMYGGGRTLGERRRQRFSATCPGLPGDDEKGPVDLREPSVALTDMDGDGRAELAFDMVGRAGAAAVCVLRGTAGGITTDGLRTVPLIGDNRQGMPHLHKVDLY
ncbi:FG-GAP repeat domain-containing protein [Actinomadura fibrosa]|uniref:FG-GAP-like repeat-containing protein n=1 Tax=Actinomadura fibrosa TaxID=111802 RepID=A0ABW2XRN9_9ACTN|nr:VCBS repeat-containing protein [Actinomadura fibrosa]